MKKALIDENNTIVQVEDVPFDMAPPCFWVDCADDVTAYRYKYENGQILPISVPEIILTPQQNKDIAKQILDETMPYAASDYPGANKQAWLDYRAAIFAIWENPQEGNLTWPARPQ